MASHFFFRPQAEIAGEYLKKGSPVYVEGRIGTRKWQDKEGQDRSPLVVADRMRMLGSRGGMGAPSSDGGERAFPVARLRRKRRREKPARSSMISRTIFRFKAGSQ